MCWYVGGAGHFHRPLPRRFLEQEQSPWLLKIKKRPGVTRLARFWPAVYRRRPAFASASEEEPTYIVSRGPHNLGATNSLASANKKWRSLDESIGNNLSFLLIHDAVDLGAPGPRNSGSSFSERFASSKFRAFVRVQTLAFVRSPGVCAVEFGCLFVPFVP